MTATKRHIERLAWTPKTADTNGWKARHLAAMNSPDGRERGVVEMLKGWLSYADFHRQQYESGIGDDGVLGQDWERIGQGIRGLLNGDCGRLDCGTVDSIICDSLRAEGLNPDD